MAFEDVKGEPPQTLNDKTFFLRVSVHCEGCKKKVKKILFQVPGVHSVDIDIRQQRAIVIGNVEADTLITKLAKSRKKAELWPEQPMQKEKKLPAKSKNRGKQPDPHHQESQNNQETGKVKTQQPSGKKKETKPPAVKSDALKPAPTKKSKKKIDDFDVNVKQKSKDNDGGADAATITFEFNCKDSGRDHHEKEQSKSEGEKVEDCVATPQPPPKGEKHGGESGNICGGEKSGGGGDRSGENGKNVKNKKSKGQNGEESGGGGDGGGANGKIVRKKNSKGQNDNSIHKDVDLESRNHHRGNPPNSVISSDGRAPHHHGYHFHPPYGSQPYGPLPSTSRDVSYSTAYPADTTSYYAPLPPPNAYLYSVGGAAVHLLPPPSDQESYLSQSANSFEMFSDENPNGCLVM